LTHDVQGQITQYKLDVSGRPTQRINSLGHSLNYEYDAAGRLQAFINENKEKYNFEYDSAIGRKKMIEQYEKNGDC
jgi:YD repeat-containing protein